MQIPKDHEADFLESVPESWRITRGKNVLRLLQRPLNNNDEVITCFRDGEVTLRANRRTTGFTVSAKEIGYQGIEPGDLVVHGMDGFAGSIGISDSRGKASPVLLVLDSNQNKRFLMYYLRGLAYREVFTALSDGIRVRSCNLSWKKLGNTYILLPPLKTQQHIVDYLDAKCAEINRAIASAEASIEEYKEYESAITFTYTTNGLGSGVGFQESGSEWLGRIPSAWKLVKWKYLLGERVEYNTDSAIKEILSLSAAAGVMPYSERIGGGNKSKNDVSAYKIARKGDIVLNSMNVVSGSVALSAYTGCVSPVYYMFYAFPGNDVRYYNHIFQSSRFQRSLFGLGKGIMVKESSTGKLNTVRMKIPSSSLKAIELPCPPFDEQRRIADYLDEKHALIGTVLDSKQIIIDELKAYKQSLIYEAVIGKRGVS